MTAPDARQSDELRGALAREAGSHAFRWVQQHPGWLARCSCREWEEPVTDEDQATAIHRRWRLHAADALLPVVTAYAERQARARAAEELRRVAGGIGAGAHTAGLPMAVKQALGIAAGVVYVRADELAADGRTDTA